MQILLLEKYWLILLFFIFSLIFGMLVFHIISHQNFADGVSYNPADTVF